MREFGDREIAGLLSALAETPDFPAAASLLLGQLAELAGAPRACLLRLDPSLENLTVAATFGFDAESPTGSVSVAELSSPLVLSTVSLTTMRGRASPDAGLLPDFGWWLALPMAQPAAPGIPDPMPRERAAALVASHDIAVLPGAAPARRVPFGVVVLEKPDERIALGLVCDLIALTGPLLSKLAALSIAAERERELSAHGDRLSLIVDALPDPVVITDGAHQIVADNARAARLIGSRPDDSPGRRRAVELNKLLFTSFLSRTGRPRRSGPRELNLVDPDEGNDLLFEVLAHPLGGRVGPENAVLSVLRDVTDLRRASSELERQIQRVRQAEVSVRGERDRLNLVLENVADPILVTDARSNIILMNEQAEQLFQIDDFDKRSRREIATVRGNDTKFTSFISEFALLDDDSRRGRMSLAHPRSGIELPVEVVSGKVRNERREPIAIVSVLHDLTKQVENERLYDALKRLNSELEQRIREATTDLAEQNARLQWQSLEVERANKLKSEFLASMSHELRTPINALIGYTALLLDGVLGAVNQRQHDALARGRAAAEHLLALINDILDLAKIEAGKMPMHFEDVPLSEIMSEVSEQIDPMVRKKQLEFVVDVAHDCPSLYTDRTKVKQILLNLLSNAVKFTNRGRVTLEARCAPGGIRMDVIDTGIGIRESDLHAIWEDFRQVDQSRTREFGGTGLGLSITRKLLERLGGSVTVQSTYGEGSKFSVYLPLVALESGADDRADVASPAGAQAIIAPSRAAPAE
jgi:PAS domain S-box-containing protein